MKSNNVTIQIKATCTEQYFPMVPFIMLYKVKVVLTFEPVNGILTNRFDHSD